MRTYFAVFRILLLIVSFAATAAAQQPPPCANIESLKLPDESAKEVSEYARTVADSVSRSWSETFENPSQKQWSVLARACVLALIVGADGKPRDIKVAHSLGMGLDEKAIEAVKQWKFQPAMKDGKPVAVAVNIEVAFRL